VQSGLAGFDGGSEQRPADGDPSGAGVGVGLAEGPGLGAGAPSTSDGSDGVEGARESGSIGGGSSREQPTAATASGTTSTRSQRITAIRTSAFDSRDDVKLDPSEEPVNEKKAARRPWPSKSDLEGAGHFR